MYGERFTEGHSLLAVMAPATFSAEQNTAWLDMSKYERLAVILNAGSVGTTLDMDIELATDSSGSNIHTLTGKAITQLDDEGFVVVELRAEELSAPSDADSTEYRYVRVEVTPVGNCVFGLEVWGFLPRYAPAANTLIDETVD